VAAKNTSQSFTHKMAAKASWHRNYVIWGDSDLISMPAGFRRRLWVKLSQMFFTAISLKYALLASYSNHAEIFYKPTD